MVRRIGIVGYGSLGKNLVDVVNAHPDMELAFVWNRSREVFHSSHVKEHHVLNDLADFRKMNPDLIVEVAHPNISEQFGSDFLSFCDYLMGSPTAMANESLNIKLRRVANDHQNCLYIPNGALWGGEDILKMADRGTLHALKITMRKHPNSFKLEDEQMKKLNETALETKEEVVLFEGSVKELCPKAPNNVNTMAAAAIAGHTLGFENTVGRLIADPKLQCWHYVEIYVEGPMIDDRRFVVDTIRKNPANPGAVTGSATYASFLSSILRAKDKGPGVHLC